MQSDLESGQPISRSPSRAGHRRPPFKRTNATLNPFPDLPPFRASPRSSSDTDTSDGGSDNISSSDSSSNSISDSDDELQPDLSSLCPSSPPPSSPGSESSSSSLLTPQEVEEWERFHDGFVPPPLSVTPHTHSWPPTPDPRLDISRESPHTYAHYGWSKNALYELKGLLWQRRQQAWWDHDEHCRRLESYCSTNADPADGIAATIFFPPPPILPASRLVSWRGPNGIVLEKERMLAQSQRLPRLPRLPTYQPWRPIFPRVGDIGDLRDPSCEAMDRTFLTIPTYGLSKIVYVDEMLSCERALRRARSSAVYLQGCPSQGWAPDSPESVYSEDGASIPSPPSPALPGALPTSNQGAGATYATYDHLEETRWMHRWEKMRRRFLPPVPASKPHPHTRTRTAGVPPPASPPATPLPQPSRPGTPLPADIATPYGGTISDAETQPPNGGHAINLSITSAIPVPAPIPVTAPVPVQVSVPVVALPQTVGAARPPTPFQTCAPSPISLPIVGDSSPVVRLPLPASSHARSTSGSGSGGDRSMPTLARELEGAGTTSGEEDGVRFSIPRPPSRAGSPLFSFFAGQDSSL